MQKIFQFQKQLSIFNNQRRWWLILSCLVVLTVSGIIFDWNHIYDSNKLLWTVVSLGLTVSVVWWYWSMKLVRTLIDYRLLESEILRDIAKSINEITQEVKNLPK